MLLLIVVDSPLTKISAPKPIDWCVDIQHSSPPVSIQRISMLAEPNLDNKQAFLLHWGYKKNDRFRAIGEKNLDRD